MKYKTTQKDRYGNMRSLEIDTGENNLEVPPMTSMIPQYEAVGGLAENHPGEPKGSDTVPAWLTPGEFVVNKEAVDIYGPQIKKMNDVGREIQDGGMSPNEAPPMYAYGGQPVYAKHGTDIKDERVVKMLDAIIEAEGGAEFTNYEGDPPTKFGVTLPTYKNYIDPNGTIEDLKKLTENEARQLFYDKYFIEPGIHKLPEEMWHNVLDQTVNSGPKGAINILQRTIGADVDGAIGPNTIKAANSFIENVPTSPGQNSEIVFNNLYSLGRDKRYKWLVAEDNKLPEPKDPKNIQKGEKRNLQQFEDGWLNRSNKFKTITPPPSKPNLDAVGNTTNLQVATSPVNPSELEESGSGWSLFDIFRGRDNNIDLPEGVTTADVNESGVPHVEMPIPEMPLSKPKPHEMYDPSADTSAEANFGLNRGGAIHLDPGGLIPGIDYPSEYKDDEWWWGDSRTSTIPKRSNMSVPLDFYGDYGKQIPRHPIFDPSLEYADRHPGAGPALAVDPGFKRKPAPSAVPALPTDYHFGEHDTSALPVSVPAGPVPDIPVSDWNADPNKITPPEPESVGDSSIMDLIFPPGVQNAEILSDLGQQDDSTTRTDMGGTSITEEMFTPPEFPEKYRSADTPPPNYGEDPGTRLVTREGSSPTSAYEQMVQDELTGEAAYDIPPPPTDYRLGEHDTGMIPVDYGPTPPTDYHFGEHDTGALPIPGEDSGYRRADLPGLLEMDSTLNIPKMWDNEKDLTKWSERNIKKLNDKNEELKKLMNMSEEQKQSKYFLNKSWEEHVKDKRAEIEKLYSDQTELERVMNQKKLIKEQNKEGAAWKEEAKLRNEIQDYEDTLNDPAAGAGEKAHAKSKIKELEEKLKETGGKAKDAESKSKLADVVAKNPVNEETEKSMYKHWESAKGQIDLNKIYADGDSNPNWNKAKDMLKGTLGFLFGDIFDSKELGRAIAVYLGSRALGYKHGESIGYVAKQYLKRVDAKNAAYDKWMLANANKYTKKSLSKFKKTRDPSDLIPVGSVPRSQGEQAKWYDKNGKARMAYKFKIKDAAGDDHVYWSWDKSGKSEVEEGWHQDPKSVPGTTEFKAEAKKYRDDIEEQLKVLLDKYDIDKHRDPDNKIYANKYHTTITPAIDKDAVYDWAIKKKLQPEKIGSFLEQAMILATKEARGSTDKPNSILPYLDRVTIDEETKDFPRLMKSEDGEYELEDTEMVRLNQKITENYGAPTNFYNAAWQEWQKGKRKVDGKSWPTVFKELAATKEANEAGWPPFALFVDNLLHEWMKENATKRGSADFVLDTVGKDKDLRS